MSPFSIRLPLERRIGYFLEAIIVVVNIVIESGRSIKYVILRNHSGSFCVQYISPDLNNPSNAVLDSGYIFVFI